MTFKNNAIMFAGTSAHYVALAAITYGAMKFFGINANLENLFIIAVFPFAYAAARVYGFNEFTNFGAKVVIEYLDGTSELKFLVGGLYIIEFMFAGIAELLGFEFFASALLIAGFMSYTYTYAKYRHFVKMAEDMYAEHPEHYTKAGMKA